MMYAKKIRINLLSINYNNISKEQLAEVFTLRKTTFKDRLNWDVVCSDGLEKDQYDNKKTDYILGVVGSEVICSVRFIDTKYPTMISGPFCRFFGQIGLPDNFVESSRFFVDKERVKKIMPDISISNVLFLAMVNYCRHKGYEGVFTVVSHAMYIILKRSGWNIIIIKKAISEKNELVYLLQLPTDDNSQNHLINKVSHKFTAIKGSLNSWPMAIERV